MALHLQARTCTICDTTCASAWHLGGHLRKRHQTTAVHAQAKKAQAKKAAAKKAEEDARERAYMYHQDDGEEGGGRSAEESLPSGRSSERNGFLSDLLGSVDRHSDDECCGFSGSQQFDLACQGVKPWDDDADDVMAALSGDY